MFQNFNKQVFSYNSISINYVIGGSGPPLLLLHGYPQTYFIWHKIAYELSKKYTVVASDLRGYGDSSKPDSDKNHDPYSKRAMAKDQIKLMKHLGFDSFLVAGHDRGGRVGHRMALDYPSVLEKLVVMDIAPTYTMYKTTDMDFAKSYYHWFFLIQPANIPETMIGSDPEFYLNKKISQWGKDSDAFTKTAFSEYLRCFTPETIKASCEDYRASASIDLEHDQIDINNNNKIECPVMVIWGDKGYVGNKYDIVAEWKKFAKEVVGYGLPCGHYLPEEAPNETLEALVSFL
tara:strand:+ start:891 stop:1760 length:870 start_codon:yes stop_codon:yes gene_type:complete